ncbi:hypothetical protein D3C79_1065130 [compost metagenome]
MPIQDLGKVRGINVGVSARKVLQLVFTDEGFENDEAFFIDIHLQIMSVTLAQCKLRCAIAERISVC